MATVRPTIGGVLATKTVEVVLREDSDAILHDVTLADLSLEERRDLERLASVREVPEHRLLLARANTQYRVGRAAVRDYVLVVPPPMPPEVFVDLVLYSSGLDVQVLGNRRLALVDLELARRQDAFLVLMAWLFVQLTENALRTHVARTYVVDESRQTLIRGRPLWDRDFGHHPMEGVTCRHHRLETDNLLNALVVAGLEAATGLLAGTRLASRANNQLFIWRSLSAGTEPRPTDYEQALRQLNRLTEHYRALLVLSHAIFFGFSPRNLLTGTHAPFPALEFSLPVLFERFLMRLLRESEEQLGMAVRFRESDRKALVDGNGDTYREVEPDFVIMCRSAPVAVLDAKFKPRYLKASPGGHLHSRNRVTTADIFQLFFYSSQLSRAFALPTPVSGAVIAPQLDWPSLLPDRNLRTVRWREDDEVMGFTLQVFSVPLLPILSALGNGATAFAALDYAPELKQFLLATTKSLAPH